MNFGQYLFLYLLGRNTPFSSYKRILHKVLLNEESFDDEDATVEAKDEYFPGEKVEMSELFDKTEDPPTHEPGFPALRERVRRELANQGMDETFTLLKK